MTDVIDETFDWRGRRVVVVADFDSFLRAATYYTTLLESRGAAIDYRVGYARERQLSEAQLRACGLTPNDVKIARLGDIAVDPELHRSDVVLLALNGLRTRRFTVAFHEQAKGAHRRPVLVSFYPGILFRFHLEGMMSRSTSDLFLLNSPHDKAMYDQAMATMGLDSSNAVLMGLPMLPSARLREEHSVPPDGQIVFVGQPTVPSGRIERLYTIERMIELARKYPSREVVIKPRHRADETTLHRMKFHYADLAKERGETLPSNFVFSYDSMPDVLERAGLVLTYSSTAAIESAVLGIPTCVLTDLGIHENIGNHFFLGSGLCRRFDELDPTLKTAVSEVWLDRHVMSASDRTGHLLERLEEALVMAKVERPNEAYFSRAKSYEAFMVDQYGHSALPQFGHTNSAESKLQRFKRRLRSARRLASAVAERGRAMTGSLRGK